MKRKEYFSLTRELTGYLWRCSGFFVLYQQPGVVVPFLHNKHSVSVICLRLHSQLVLELDFEAKPVACSLFSPLPYHSF